MISNNMRISGLASGMDIDSMVKNLMSANRLPLDKLNQSKTILEWQRDSYRSVNTKISEFRNMMFDLRLESNFNSRKAVSANENAVSVSASSTATEGVYSLEVTQLAEAAKLTSTAAVGAKALQGVNTKLQDLNLANNTTFTIGGEKGTATINVNTGDSIDGLVRAVNEKANTTGVRLSYDANLDHFFFTSTNTGAQAKVNLHSEETSLFSNVLKLGTSATTTAGSLLTGAKAFAGGGSSKINDALTADQTFKVKYDGVEAEFTISKTTTINSLINQINSSGIGKKGVSAYLDSNNKLAFTNPADNATTPIEFSDMTSDSTDILVSLGLDSVTVTARDYYTSSDAGLDALIKYNGVSGQYATNSFEINGLNFTAKQVTGPIDITVTQDTDAIFDKVKGFVDKYNELIDSTNKTLDERRYRDFLPLTAEQKESMSEDEVKQWEEKAKSGMLRNDQMISSALSGFRTAISSVVSGLPSDDMKQLSQIGITTGSYSEKGKLYINTTQLKKAIAEQPDQVAALFTANDGSKETSAGDGIATRLVEQADTLMQKLRAKAGTTSSVDTTYLIGKRMKEYDDQIVNMNRRLEALETKYYNQFTSMEKYINQMNSQSMYMMQQFSGGA
ncbi:flagellar filament capping protein FliD [Paenibacillus abyssi]|uniref:Flagellar hook-associated protein 2 n=1 Tax=Paenibacillus abyssi TaxID=1340531 RepID=A0A917CK57_9BACL|nr:flagellar filament capping protein FliD [Paenibacillus abyssi]GGF91384.1 hypothetical protein GCM10010916_05810 [Paenibacillus abyssi]